MRCLRSEFKGFFFWQGETKPFKPYTHRYHVPYKASGSTSPFWYSMKRASTYIIVLASYSAYGMKLYFFKCGISLFFYHCVYRPINYLEALIINSLWFLSDSLPIYWHQLRLDSKSQSIKCFFLLFFLIFCLLSSCMDFGVRSRCSLISYK